MQVKRTEQKMLINQAEKLLLVERLDHLLPRDAHSTSPEGYEVRTLYFDTLADRCFVEKADGLRVHEKIRIRTYGPDSGVIKLESKYKDGELQTKRSMLLDRPTLDALCAGDYAVLLKSPDPMAPFFYGKLSAGMFPKAIIQYQRLSFCLDVNEIRITFDSDIRATESCLDLYQEPLLTRPILPPGLTVLEIKYNGFLLGYLKDALRGLDRSPAGFSKYMSGRMFSRSLL